MYLTLPSNSSMKFFPNNKVSDFTTKLPVDFDLDGSWEIGLAEYVYPHVWNNILSSDERWMRFRNQEINVKVDLPLGFYPTPQSIVVTLLSLINKAASPNKVFFGFYFNQHTRKVEISLSENQSLYIGYELRQMLGFTSNGEFSSPGSYESERAADINRGFHSIYVYCDIVDHRIVGDTSVPLLTIIPVQGEDGDFIHKRFKKIHYHTISKKSFSDIHISLRDDQGNLIPFQRGKVIVVLHVRKKKLSQL